MRALVVIDIQNEYAEGGMYELPRFEQAAERAAVAIAVARSADIPVLHVRHEIARSSEWGFVPGTHGAAIHEAVAPLEAEQVIVKQFPNAFLETDLHSRRLEALGDGPVAFAGMMTSTCVDSTVRAASDAGIEAVLVTDACAAPELEHEGVSVSADAVNAAFIAALGDDFAELTTADDLSA